MGNKKLEKRESMWRRRRGEKEEQGEKKKKGDPEMNNTTKAIYHT